MCRCRDALRRLAIRKIDRREHPSRVRKPFHTQESQCATASGKPPGLQIHAPKSCANHAAGSRLHVPQIKRRYTHRGRTQAAARTAGSTNIARISGGVRPSRLPRGPRPARAHEQVDRAAGRWASYLLCGGRCGRVQCAIARLSTCPNACLPPRASAMFACVCSCLRLRFVW